MPKPMMTAAVTSLLLSGCGGAPSEKAGTATPTAAAASATGEAASSFNAADACATLPKDKVAAVTGLKVDSAALGPTVQQGETTAGFSTCNYNFAGGGTLVFFVRQSPVDDNTPEAIARTRAQIANNGAKVIDVPGLGAAAFSADQMHQLHVFVGANRYLYFMSATSPTAKPIAEVELALARAVIG